MRKKIHVLFLFFLMTFITTENAYCFAITTATTWASETAAEILRRGGNATDAAVAAAFTLNVTQPYNSGIGGGGFFLVHSKSKTDLWNCREMAPRSAHPKMFLREDGSPIPYEPDRVTGPNPVGIPGTLHCLYEAHRKYGKLPWKTLVAPAITLAKEGFPLTPKFAEYLADEWPRISKFPLTASLLGNGEGAPKKAGATLRQPVLAKTLEAISTQGPLSFYKGELARSWISEANELGVKITSEDLESYRPEHLEPLSYQVFGLRALTAHPPSASGIMVAASIRYLEHYYREHSVTPPDSAKRIVVTAETLKHFQKIRNDRLADRSTTQIDPQKFLGSAEEKKTWKELDEKIAKRLENIETATAFKIIPDRTSPHAETFAQANHSTTHLNIVDDQAMAVSYTTTIEMHFGSGMLVPNHGFFLNNELSDFNPEPESPNAPAPGKRPRSNMSPTLLFDQQTPVALVGAAGGGRIPSAVVQILENYFIHKMSAREAVAFPRIHPDSSSKENLLLIEDGFTMATQEKLKEAGFKLNTTKAIATAQAIFRREPKAKWDAASEPRADGLAIAWEKLAPTRRR